MYIILPNTMIITAEKFFSDKMGKICTYFDEENGKINFTEIICDIGIVFISLKEMRNY